MSGVPSVKEINELYEDGKHRRYNLLFAVNGGAFAVAKLLKGEPGKKEVVLGELEFPVLAGGMALFTLVMVVDIFMFGWKMRKRYASEELFGPWGWGVLFATGWLLCAGWLLAGWGKAGWVGLGCIGALLCVAGLVAWRCDPIKPSCTQPGDAKTEREKA